MDRLPILALASLLAASGCKGETVVKPDPKTERELSDCETSLDDKETYIRTLEARLAELEIDGDRGNVVVEFRGELEDGAISQISGQPVQARPKTGAGGPRPDPQPTARDEELYEQFVSQLRRSRPSMTQCYQNALKKDTRLQARSVTLNILVDYQPNGRVSGASFQPRISDSFDQCMQNVANRWELPAMQRRISFNYRQLLTPQ